MTIRKSILAVLEGGRPLVYTHEDLTAFHGFGFPGGVAHAFKVMELALPKLDFSRPPERREITIKTPFRGPGGRDAFELVTRCVTDGRYEIDAELMKPERGEILKGYVFYLSYRGRTIGVQIKEGIVREDFVLLGRKPNRCPEEDEQLIALKRDMADRLLVLSATDAYEIFMEHYAEE